MLSAPDAHAPSAEIPTHKTPQKHIVIFGTSSPLTRTFDHPPTLRVQSWRLVFSVPLGEGIAARLVSARQRFANMSQPNAELRNAGCKPTFASASPGCPPSLPALTRGRLDVQGRTEPSRGWHRDLWDPCTIPPHSRPTKHDRPREAPSA